MHGTVCEADCAALSVALRGKERKGCGCIAVPAYMLSQMEQALGGKGKDVVAVPCLSTCVAE
eukprot:scaffold78505_cov22-Tisochrysis_lutea.AAC.2